MKPPRSQTSARTPESAPPIEPTPAAWPTRRGRTRDRHVKRETVIRIAARTFNQRGYSNTSLDDIAGALKVSKPTIYYYVANKEQLLLECIVAGLNRIIKPLRARSAAGTGARGRLNQFLHHYAEALASEYGWCMVRAEDLGLGAQSIDLIKRLKSQIDQGIRQLLRDGVRDGSIAVSDVKMTAFALAGALNWMGHWYREDRSLTASQVADAFIEFFDCGLMPRSTRADTARQRPSTRRRGSA